MKTRVPGQEGAKGNAAERYRGDSNMVALGVAAVIEEYAHESLNFNDTVACEEISKWKAGLKEDMDVRSDVLKANLQHKEALSTTEAGYTMNDIWLKGLLTESVYELRLVACIATGALVKGGSRFKVPAQVKVAAYQY
nr:zinc finger, CCHC-type [Tanacetum cinerariifolium]